MKNYIISQSSPSLSIFFFHLSPYPLTASSLFVSVDAFHLFVLFNSSHLFLSSLSFCYYFHLHILNIVFISSFSSSCCFNRCKYMFLLFIFYGRYYHYSPLRPLLFPLRAYTFPSLSSLISDVHIRVLRKPFAFACLENHKSNAPHKHVCLFSLPLAPSSVLAICGCDYPLFICLSYCS